MNSDFSDFIRFFPIFRLFPTSRLLDSTALLITCLKSLGFKLCGVANTQTNDQYTYGSSKSTNASVQFCNSNCTVGRGPKVKIGRIN